MYEEIIEKPDGMQETIFIRYTDDNGVIFNIPIDEANADYQRYLKWKAEQEVN